MEEQKKKKSFRKEYLNDFQRDLNGRYVYMGQHMVFEGNDSAWRKDNLILWACCLVPAILIIIVGVLPGAGLIGKALLLIPYALMLISLFIVIWKMVRFSYSSGRMRQYVHSQTVAVIPVYSLIMAGLGTASVICMIIALIAGLYKENVFAVILYFVTGISFAAGGFCISKILKRENWTVEK